MTTNQLELLIKLLNADNKTKQTAIHLMQARLGKNLKK